MLQNEKNETISKAEKERRELMERLTKTKGTLATSSKNKEDSGQLLSMVINSTATFEKN
ncbi:hypothetical protein L4D76_15260 [Photobacterium sagamiensis]|uniref:hypothetical protein n=1 Tax=Photobacterium sagamiensis TaxID=2910241 RepID=UPI003D123B8C